MVLGVFLGIKPVENTTLGVCKGSLIILIDNNQFNLFIFYLKITIYPLLMFFIGYILCINYYCFWGNFLIYTIFVGVIFKNIIIGCFFDGFWGIIGIVIFWLPIICVSSFFYFCYLTDLYENISGLGRKSMFIPYKLSCRRLRPIFINRCLFVFMFNFVFGSIMIIFFKIFT